MVNKQTNKNNDIENYPNFLKNILYNSERLGHGIVNFEIKHIDYEHEIPFKVGDIVTIRKKEFSKMNHQTHPRKNHYQEPIIDVVNLNNRQEYWLSQGQLQGYLKKREEEKNNKT